MTRFVFALTMVCSAALTSSGAEAIDFSHDIVPILKRHCVTCHGGRESEGEFSINTRKLLIDSGMVEPGEAASSHLLELITSEDPESQMPPSDRVRVSDKEVQLIRAWIDDGLVWEPGFTFAVATYEPPLRPRPVELPPAREGRDHPIDRLLDGYLADNGLPIPGPISDERFLRRAYLDIVGLLPPAESVDAFRADRSPEKRSVLIDELLSRELDYADHWLSFFNDLLRNDYSGTGFITGGRKQVTKWLYASLRRNMPFDDMTRELVSPTSAESQGFIDGIKWRGTVSAGQTLEIQFAQSVSQSFLGINMKCASCHDSFIDRWTLKDAYGLAAVYADKDLQLHRCDKPTGETQRATWLFPELGNVDPDADRLERLRQLAALMTDPQNGRFARTFVNRLWHRMMGRGIVHPLDAMQTEPWNEALLEYLANRFVDSGYDVKAVLRLIATSQAYQSQMDVVGEGQSSAYRYRGPRQRRMTAEQFLDAVWQLTGTAPTRHDAPIFRSRVNEAEISATPLRGKWIWRPIETPVAPGDETLLMRTFVEVPGEISSAGAVITCDNEFTLFVNGRQVAAGTDWTSPQQVNLRPQLKQGRNQIVVRAKNGGGASPNPAGLYVQGAIRLVDGSQIELQSDETWQFNRQVPEGREGRLSSPKKGWEKVHAGEGLGVWNEVLNSKGKALLAQIAEGAQTPMVRASLMKNNPLMQSLGRPLREQIVSMRPDQISTLEAIDLANDASLSESLRLGAEAWINRDFASTGELIDGLFRATLTRGPTESERDLFLQVLGEDPQPAQLMDAMWTLLMLPEFMLIR